MKSLQNKRRKVPHPLANCIYCGKQSDDLSDEHIIPKALHGRDTLSMASCEKCCDITSKFELTVTRHSYFNVRAKHNFPISKKSRKEKFKATFIRKDGSSFEQEIPISEYPLIFPVFHFPPPGILMNLKPTSGSPEMQISMLHDDVQTLFSKTDEDVVEIVPTSTYIIWSDFCKLLAKIAHGFLIKYIGKKGYTPLLPRIILGIDECITHFVGGKFPMNQSKIDLTHSNLSENGFEIYVQSISKNTSDNSGYIIINIMLMGGKFPIYTVVAGYYSDFEDFMTSHIEHCHSNKNK